LRRANTLASHNYGVGAFIYLRRVFEALIDGHRRAYEQAAGTSIPNYEELKIDDRIKALKASLPEFLVKHRSIYGVMSKGVHELDEQTCLRYFPTIRSAIMLILEQDLLARRKKEAETQLAADIGKVVAATRRKTPPRAT
jgi:hypothetical protein